MCGIVYKQNFNGAPVNNDILQQFDLQRSRGTQGFGLFDGKHLKRSAKEDGILKWLIKYDSPIIMFHHRFPTSTINVKRAAHPMSTGKYFGKTQYVLVHNGVIHNASEMYKKHAADGITYSTELDDGTFNDSETLLWDIALTLEGKQEKPTIEGRAAFVCMKKVNGELVSMYFGRNAGSPLKLMYTEEQLALSSEGEGDMVTIDTLFTWDYATKKLVEQPMVFPQYSWPSYNKPRSIPMGNYSSSQYDDDDEYWKNRYGSYDNYDDYYEDKYGYQRPKQGFKKTQKAGAWLGDDLQDRYQKLLDQYPKPQASEIIEGEIVEEDDTERLSAEDTYFSHRADASEVEAKALNYLSQYTGFFSQAYWALEAEYAINLQENDTPEVLRKRLVIEGALEYINSDPEYEDEDSISSIWEGSETIWTPQQLQLS